MFSVFKPLCVSSTLLLLLNWILCTPSGKLQVPPYFPHLSSPRWSSCSSSPVLDQAALHQDCELGSLWLHSLTVSDLIEPPALDW